MGTSVDTDDNSGRRWESNRRIGTDRMPGVGLDGSERRNAYIYERGTGTKFPSEDSVSEV